MMLLSNATTTCQKNLGPERSLSLNISTKRVANCNYLSKNTLFYLLTCSFLNILFCNVSCHFHVQNLHFFLASCVYSLMAFAMDRGPLDRRFILFVAFLFGLPLESGKLKAFVLSDNTLYAYFEVWLKVICSFMSSKTRI